ncbi:MULTISPECIES: hypothetical protein [Acetobacter]|jgi:hypothetical protein|uniref:Uncharacterized protein n=1 Tax=Acetobacter peroxydans TaxID=104098 RepID=A0A4Y3TXL2_9PROT|nr:hypothetical protein [Acetobacter peroxydans]MCH4144016.1 hypothetical protein [Acetobacter peroxydans]MCI1394839.1 hypothetical protein [Acetobacter peroxydans]MCI1412235.1 hypothetical protein [Acetobacter peroxydans]MCI1439136.1 hypothetical protein [Acetobacter peroxydans]MCI1567532.1 hypothetical protein [Acetobacter peroxydans]
MKRFIVASLIIAASGLVIADANAQLLPSPSEIGQNALNSAKNSAETSARNSVDAATGNVSKRVEQERTKYTTERDKVQNKVSTEKSRINNTKNAVQDLTRSPF